MSIFPADLHSSIWVGCFNILTIYLSLGYGTGFLEEQDTLTATLNLCFYSVCTKDGYLKTTRTYGLHAPASSCEILVSFVFEKKKTKPPSLTTFPCVGVRLLA
jgi:hypothetical protein